MITRINSYTVPEILILGKQQAEGYPLEITLNSEQEFVCGYLSLHRQTWVAAGSQSSDG